MIISDVIEDLFLLDINPYNSLVGVKHNRKHKVTEVNQFAQCPIADNGR